MTLIDMLAEEGFFEENPNSEEVTMKYMIDTKLKTEFEKLAIKKAIEKQKLDFANASNELKEFYEECWNDGFPYSGVTGGQFSYILTPTSIGINVVMRCNITHLEKDITDYCSF